MSAVTCYLMLEICEGHMEMMLKETTIFNELIAFLSVWPLWFSPCAAHIKRVCGTGGYIYLCPIPKQAIAGHARYASSQYSPLLVWIKQSAHIQGNEWPVGHFTFSVVFFRVKSWRDSFTAWGVSRHCRRAVGCGGCLLFLSFFLLTKEATYCRFTRAASTLQV